ncbi:tetratricopeptide repeat protein [Polymorphobacter sp.]|uniref:tetratricopeptide repeat protein n=1 Tax=Polymorphobacter sp. TaxID=1909290 RepID=UPI003F711AEB
MDHPRRPPPSPLRTSLAGLTTGAAATAALLDGSAALAKADGLKAQAEALRAAAAARPARQQPAAASLDAGYDQAKALLASGDTAGALAGFRRALAAEPQSVDAMNGLGISYDRMGRHDIARGWYEAALAVDPEAAPVLSNLGYSLYLQGEYRAAIPFLQAALRSNDRLAMATAQRLLALVTAALDAPVRKGIAPFATPVVMAATSDTTARFGPEASTEPGAARIEYAANGEARLILGGDAPAPMLVAALGEAATLVLVADSWTADDDRRLDQQAAATALAEARDARQRLETAALVTIEQPRTRLVFAEAADLRPERPLLAAVIDTATTDPRPATVAPTTQRLPASPSLDALAARPLPASGPTLTSAHTAPGWQPGLHTPSRGDVAPGWLIAVRRGAPTSRGGNAPAAPLQLLGADGPAQAFECDDLALNRFAARHRAGPDDDGAAARQAAIARLEALIERVHRA